MPETVIADFNGQNWLVTPAVSPKAQPSPATWMVVLSGVAVAKGFTGVSGTEYTIHITPDVTGPINFAINNLGAPKQVQTFCSSMLNNGTLRSSRHDPR